MQPHDEDVISIDGFTYHVHLLTEQQQKHVSDIRRSDALIDHHRFSVHVTNLYKTRLLDELGEMLKEDGKK